MTESDLYQACRKGDLERVKFLVSNGVDVSAHDNHAVAVASDDGHIEIVKYLVLMGADVTSNKCWALRCASLSGYLEVAKFLLSRGADFNKLSNKHKTYFKVLKCFRRWRKVVFRRFFRETVIPLYYSPGFPGGIRVKQELADIVCS